MRVNGLEFALSYLFSFLPVLSSCHDARVKIDPPSPPKRSNPLVTIGIVIGAVIAGVIASRQAATPATTNSNASVLEVSARVLEGKISAPPSEVPLRVAALVNGFAIAESGVENDQYRLELPAKVDLTLTPMTNVDLLHGEARLPGNGLDLQLIMYQDVDKNNRYDQGDPKVVATVFPPDKDAELRGFFRYKIVLIDQDATLEVQKDNPTGAKNFYRYNVQAKRGWNVLEGELASNGFEMRMQSANTWDLLPELPRGAGGESGPPQFAPN